MTHSPNLPKYLFALLLIVIIGSLFRTFNLDRNPYGFFCDEAATGYIAYSLLTTGKDDHGENWPFLFRSFGEYKGPTLIYSTIPFVKLMGLNELSTRLPSAIYGIFSIILIYFIFYLKKQPLLGLSAAFLLAISPWHIHFSRIAFENVAYIFFLLLGILFWIILTKQKKIVWLFLAILSLAVSFYTAHAAKIIIPFTILGLLVTSHKLLFKNLKILSFVIIALLIFLITSYLNKDQLLARFNQFKIDRSIEQTITAYLSHFSFPYLFEKGDAGYPGQYLLRHSVLGMGQLHLVQLPLILISIFVLKKYYSKKTIFLLLIATVIYPIPSLLSDASLPNASRSFFGLIPLTILSATGLTYVMQLSYKNRFLGKILVLSIILSFSLSVIGQINLLKEYPTYSSGYWGWQAGPRDLIQYFFQHQTEYNKLVLDNAFNGPGSFIDFYTIDQPSLRQRIIVNDMVIDNIHPENIYAISAYNYSKFNEKDQLRTIDYYQYPSGEIGFYLVTRVANNN